MRRCRGAGLAALAALLIAVAVDTDQVQQRPWAETTEGTSLNLTCQHPKIDADSTHWYRQFPHQAPQLIATAVLGTKPVLDPEGSLTVSADRRSSALWLGRPRRGDAAVYYCALGATCVTAALVFGNGTQLTVEPNISKSSDPQVIVMKSKKLEEGNSAGKAACLARNSPTKNISLEMPSQEVIYEQSTSILTSKGLYNAIKVARVTTDMEVTCTAKFDNRVITAQPEEEAEEPVTGGSDRVCNSTAPSAQDPEEQRVNMLSMAVLGLRVLLAKSIAFNALMSIKLFLFSDMGNEPKEEQERM
ncbi:M1-specific T cell receptor alpha chain-like [Onychostruthus taczanowskii]|uniref:M1-specific T cell receptor alpha chain-like n=1 Tax=Onychostruthus taczanowskii TaxID=356909 RepID=UPI001B800149|nr:M1-specific T cell receptor alpha chain-like [Onychostruthus taczanowskii]